MGDEGLNGLVRGRSCRTTIPAKDAVRAGELVDKEFTPPCPNRVWPANSTYCRSRNGFIYDAFNIDFFSIMIIGWHGMTSRTTELIAVHLRMALWQRNHQINEAGE
jgi:putative transposase